MLSSICFLFFHFSLGIFIDFPLWFELFHRHNYHFHILLLSVFWFSLFFFFFFFVDIVSSWSLLLYLFTYTIQSAFVLKTFCTIHIWDIWQANYLHARDDLEWMAKLSFLQVKRQSLCAFILLLFLTFGVCFFFHHNVLLLLFIAFGQFIETLSLTPNLLADYKWYIRCVYIWRQWRKKKKYIHIWMKQMENELRIMWKVKWFSIK